MTTVLAVTVTALLATGACLALIRVVRGPSVLDRIVATDVLLAIVVVAIASEAAFSRDATALPVLAVLSVLGFIGSVSVARFARSTSRAAGSSSSTPAAERPDGSPDLTTVAEDHGAGDPQAAPGTREHVAAGSSAEVSTSTSASASSASASPAPASSRTEQGR